jgi:hypothetical protein
MSKSAMSTAIEKPTADNAKTVDRGPLPPETEDQIRSRAYELYEARDRIDGQDLDDWLQAEAQVIGRREKLAA